MEQVQITPELYEQIKAEVLAEYKATNKAKAKERAAERMERSKAFAEENRKAEAMFEPTKVKYTPLLAQRFKNTFMSGGRSLYDIISTKLAEAQDIAIRTLGYRDVLDAYRDNKAEEANKIASEILDAMLKN